MFCVTSWCAKLPSGAGQAHHDAMMLCITSWSAKHPSGTGQALATKLTRYLLSTSQEIALDKGANTFRMAGIRFRRLQACISYGKDRRDTFPSDKAWIHFIRLAGYFVRHGTKGSSQFIS